MTVASIASRWIRRGGSGLLTSPLSGVHMVKTAFGRYNDEKDLDDPEEGGPGVE